MLFGVLCVIFAVSTAFGQVEPSDSHIIRVTKEIDVVKENVEGLNKTVQDLTKTIEGLNKSVNTLNTTVGELKTTVTRIDERTKGIIGWQYAIFGVIGTIFASMVVFFFTQWISHWRKRNSEGEAIPAPTAQVGQNRETPTWPGQVNEVESTSTRPAQLTNFPRGDDLIDRLKFDYHATGKKV